MSIPTGASKVVAVVESMRRDHHMRCSLYDVEMKTYPPLYILSTISELSKIKRNL
jgi:hypothetical protein